MCHGHVGPKRYVRKFRWGWCSFSVAQMADPSSIMGLAFQDTYRDTRTEKRRRLYEPSRVSAVSSDGDARDKIVPVVHRPITVLRVCTDSEPYVHISIFIHPGHTITGVVLNGGRTRSGTAASS